MSDTISVVLVPVDGSSGAGAAAREAGQLARGMGLPVELLFAFPRDPMDMFGVPGETTSQSNLRYFDPDAFAELRNAASRKAFDAARKELGDVQAEEVVLPGLAAEAIVEKANNTPGAIVVMGRRGLSRLGEMFMGSVSQRVMHQAKCPVMVVH